MKILLERVPDDVTAEQIRLAFTDYGSVRGVEIRPPRAVPWLIGHSAVVDMPDRAAGPATKAFPWSSS